ncbi:chromate transporter [Paenibacillus sp. 1P07SE]|uniref:chromate transporter n=1 Tax=Paenibacillus sp. 1P07SE TaxID=3132209 RepID=UPI0039A75BCF
MWELFITFLKIGCLSFGGGYAIMPIIEYEAVTRDWLSNTQFQELVSLAGIAPGPIAVNSATLIGYQHSGLIGAASATAGMALPSLLVMALFTVILLGSSRLPVIRRVLYGLRPVIAGLIAYAALRFALPAAGMDGLGEWTFLGTLLIAAGCFVALTRYRAHPLSVIVAAGLAGIILF